MGPYRLNPCRKSRLATLSGLILLGILQSLSSCGSAADADPLFHPLKSRMISPRFFHQQTLLSDGIVLITGGLLRAPDHRSLAQWWDFITPTAEIFDPGSGEFIRVGDMSTPRANHTALLLGDRRVAVLGGDPGGLIEIFDPNTSSFTTAGHLRQPRFDHTATLLKDGTILVAGGSYLTPEGFHTLDIAEIFDPVTGKSATLSAKMKAKRYHHTATLLPDGRVLIIGGSDDRTMEAFDPATGAFTPINSLLTDREDHRATLLKDGSILISGGSDSKGKSLAACEIYDPVANAIRYAKGAMRQAREDHTADLLPTGEVLITGGEDNRAGPGGEDIVLGTAEIYSPESDSFKLIGRLTVDRDDHRSSRLSDGTILLTGGETQYSEGLDSAETFTPTMPRD